MDIPYRSMVWLTYRVAATFAFGLPLLLVIWSAIRKEASMLRLLSIYWKIASLLGISLLLLTSNKSIGYVTFFLAPILMVLSVWFWVDLNEELADLPPWRPLPLSIRIWRWALSGFGGLSTVMGITSITCILKTKTEICLTWIEAPQGLHLILGKIFKFLFGANWTHPIASFIGYIALVAYIIGIIQWSLIRLPKTGRIAGGF